MGYIAQIIHSPDAALCAAYGPHPIGYHVSAVDCPIVYCDIYLDNVFYRTISATVPSAPSGPNNTGGFDFDVRDACQEYLGRHVSEWYQPYILSAPKVTATLYCKFRGSTLNADGTITPQGPVPVQGTWNTPPQPGGQAMTSSTSMVGNLALQHGQGADAEAWMWYNYPNPMGPLPRICLMTNRPASSWKGTLDDWFTMPIYCGQLSPSFGIETYVLFVRGSDGLDYTLHDPTSVSSFITLQTGKAYYLPAGVKNLETLATNLGQAPPPFSTFGWYQVGLGQIAKGSGALEIRWIGPKISIKKPCNKPRKLHFLSSLGMYDWVEFHEQEELLRVESSRWERRFGTSPFAAHDKRQSTRERFNVRSGEEETATCACPENELEWMKELLETTSLYFEDGKINPINVGQFVLGQNTEFVPAIMLDGDYVTKKVMERYAYEVAVTFARSNRRKTLRN